MGPPELPGGNPYQRRWIEDPAPVLQWGRRNYPAETYKGRNILLENADVLQWGRRNYPAETRLTGAQSGSSAVVLQWGRRNYPAETTNMRSEITDSEGASMGPPELPGGNLDHHAPSFPCFWCFNGAAGITRRKRPMPRATTARSAKRFNGAAGITRRKPLRAGFLTAFAMPASMGPPELPGGNRGNREAEKDCLQLLQWGRRNYPAETW